MTKEAGNKGTLVESVCREASPYRVACVCCGLLVTVEALCVV